MEEHPAEIPEIPEILEIPEIPEIMIEEETEASRGTEKEEEGEEGLIDLKEAPLRIVPNIEFLLKGFLLAATGET